MTRQDGEYDWRTNSEGCFEKQEKSTKKRLPIDTLDEGLAGPVPIQTSPAEANEHT